MNSSHYHVGEERKEAWSAWIDQGSGPLITTSEVSQGEAFSPFATMQLRGDKKCDSSLPCKRQIKSLVNSPFTRIKKVERMIIAQKQQLKDFNPPIEPQKIANLFKPQFKIKSLKSTHKKEKKTLESSTNFNREFFHIKNVAFQNMTIDTICNPHEDSKFGGGGLCNFSQTFKNRCRLQRRSPRNHKEASLLDRLNKISDKSPLQRYKSKALDSFQRVAPFFPQ